MSKPKVFEKPSGVKDYLPDAASKLRAVERKVLGCMSLWGYQEIITPTLEFYETVGAASATTDKKLFKLLDQKGNTLVMRSEMTAPIARVAASLLKDEPLPLRLSYHANVFRAIEEEAGRTAEFYQTGVELIGDASAESDAEVLALAIACLKAAGVETFKIALGHVGFLNGLLRQALEDRPQEQTVLKEFLLQRDYVGYRRYLDLLQLSERVRFELEGILRMRGGDEVCGRASQLANDPLAKEALLHLCEIWDILGEYGVRENVVIDLSMIGDFSYYTGMTFEGYASTHGFPVCSGGRYDNLLAQFGRPAQATGFALKTTRIIEADDPQLAAGDPIMLIVYTATGRKQALEQAQELRVRSRKAVELCKVETMEQMDEIKQDATGVCIFGGKTYHGLVKYC